MEIGKKRNVLIPMYPDADGYFLITSFDGLPVDTTVTNEPLEGFKYLVVAVKGSANTDNYMGFASNYAGFMASPFVAYVDGSTTDYDPCSVGDGCWSIV